MESTIKLFRALPVRTAEGKVDDELTAKTVKKGFVFAPEVVANYSNYDELVEMVEKTVGLSAEQMNSSFHKSWTKVKDADVEQLVVEQIAHYLTTYGKEYPALYLAEKEVQWGVDDLAGKVQDLGDIEMDKVQDADYVYIPSEVLDVPGLKLDAIRLVVIKGYTVEELTAKLINLLGSGLALKADTLQAALEVAMFVNFSEVEVAKVRNKEAKSALYDFLGLFPENPVEFLRYVVFKATSRTLLIKSPGLIEEIRGSNNLNVVKLFNDYEAMHGLERLAEVFYRFKPIFLAFRTNERMRVVVNRIRRLAVENHRPMPEDFLNTVTAKLDVGQSYYPNPLLDKLEGASTFRKIRLAYALKFRTGKAKESILYRIRNGKGYATSFGFKNSLEAERVLTIVLNSIADDVEKNVKGKKVYIPNNVHYSLPATEKQFTGNFPSGTCVVIPKDMIAGIHWNNVKHTRIDLDLSLISLAGKVGWDSLYRTDEGDVLFSGDVTDAPRGASELFYVKRRTKTAHLMVVNYYNYDEEIEVPFKILVAREAVRDFRSNYTVNPNNVVLVADTVINQKQKILGLLVTTTTECRFYFAETYVGRSISSSSSEFATHCRQYLLDFYENTLRLEDILTRAGAEVVRQLEEADINLSPEALEKDSFLALLR